ncbi:hypothetical protein BKA70DRAFT_1258164 [Coprinopsis sp. MPI-PUGE-AT-0042]|nr:hypothetical protein BKA70DRAFT_1258164 [Coprinopsis sp. MPI-PUGE-AT-0042]
MPRWTRNETIGFLTGYSLATVTTLVRLCHRLRRGQAWWDDLWAFIALFFLVFSVTVNILLNVPSHVETLYPKPAASFMLWISFELQPAVIWSTRLSIQATVIRFLSPGPHRTISRVAFVALIAMWIVAAITKVFYCGIPVPQIPQCMYKDMPSIVALVLDVLSTAWLVGWPTYILLRMKLPRSGRRLIVACFVASLLLGAMDIYHATNIILGAVSRINVSGHLEPMLAVVLSNLLVLVTSVYRTFRGANGVGETAGGGSTDETGSSSSDSTSKRETDVGSEGAAQYVIDSGVTSSVGRLTSIYSSIYQFSTSLQSRFTNSSRGNSGAAGPESQPASKEPV